MIGDLNSLAARQRGLTLLVLFGSRARGDAGANADWDFGFLADSSVDPWVITAALAETVGSERLDLGHRASGFRKNQSIPDPEV